MTTMDNGGKLIMIVLLVGELDASTGLVCDHHQPPPSLRWDGGDWVQQEATLLEAGLLNNAWTQTVLIFKIATNVWFTPEVELSQDYNAINRS